MLSAVELCLTGESERPREFHRREELRQKLRVESGEMEIGILVRERIRYRHFDLTRDVRPHESEVHVPGEIDALPFGPIETEVQLARALLRKLDHGPANVGGIYRVSVQSEMEIAVREQVAPVAGDTRRRESGARALPPH